MRKRVAAFVTAVPLLMGSYAHACSLAMPDPRAIYETSQVIVMARPIEISPAPEELEKSSIPGTYEQNVTWQVLYSWKGDLLPDDRVTTSRGINRDDPCAGWDVISDYQPRLVYASGESPFREYYSVIVSGAIYLLQFLQDQSKDNASLRTQDGT